MERVDHYLYGNFLLSLTAESGTFTPPILSAFMTVSVLCQPISDEDFYSFSRSSQAMEQRLLGNPRSAIFFELLT